MIKIPQLFRTYIWLIDTIRRFQPISLEGINERWMGSSLSDGVPLHRNTFLRHLEAIQEMFDVEIVCSRGRHATYRLVDDMGIRRNSWQRWVLSTMSVAGAVREARSLQNRILLESVPSGDILLTEVTRAMQSGHTLYMRYQKFVDSTPYEAEVEPYCLKLFRQRWYLLGRRIDRSYLAIYALDRVQHLMESEHAFVLDAAFDAHRYFQHSFGVFQPMVDEVVQRIVLRTYDGEWNYLRSLPLHASQQEVLTTDEYVDFAYHLYPTLDFKLELLSHIAHVSVLEPESLRKDIVLMLEKGMQRNAQAIKK